ncbi:MAG: hypothetical protein ACKOPK_18360, partial [Dolichospermum sp.]
FGELFLFAEGRGELGTDWGFRGFRCGKVIKDCWGLLIAKCDLVIRFVDDGRVVERFLAAEKGKSCI